MQPIYQYAAIVERIVDGDTVDFNVDLGFRTWMKGRFRLAGINTPERGQPGWAEANAFLAEQIPIGSWVVIQTYKPPLDKYGRWLAVIWKGETNINELMVTSQHAVPYMV